MIKIYEYFGDFEWFWAAKNKAKQSQMPGFGRKSEVLNSKSDNSGGVAGCLLPRVGRETSWKGTFEKTKPIYFVLSTA